MYIHKINVDSALLANRGTDAVQIARATKAIVRDPATTIVEPRRDVMNAKNFYSLLVSSALLIGADAGFAAGAPDSLDALVQATLRGDHIAPTHSIGASRGPDAGPSAAEIARRVLSGEAVSGRRVEIIVAAEGTPGRRSQVHADPQRLARQFLYGRAG
jgi:hypothetical protein